MSSSEAGLLVSHLRPEPDFSEEAAEQGTMVSFGKEANIRTQYGTLFPLVCTSDDLYTLRVLPFVCNLGPRALPVERLPGIAHS